MQIDYLASKIEEELINYSNGVTEKVKRAVDKVSQEVNEEIKNKVPFNNRTGKYIKAFRVKTVYEDKHNKRNTWHVVDGQYRLTHLLEFGHAKSNGGRVKAFPHIRYGDSLAKSRLEELVKEAVSE